MVSWLEIKISFYGRRLQLIIFLISSYMSYWVRTLAIQKCIVKKISSMTSKFFFHRNDQNKIHMIAWDKATLPHSKGGMGLLFINQLDTINKFKITWKCLNPKSPFGIWCWHKYHSLWLNSAHKYSSL